MKKDYIPSRDTGFDRWVSFMYRLCPKNAPGILREGPFGPIFSAVIP
jgi:hypothetical protein